MLTQIQAQKMALEQQTFVDDILKEHYQMYLITQGKRSGNYSDWYLHDLETEKLNEYLKPYPHSVKMQVAELGF